MKLNELEKEKWLGKHVVVDVAYADKNTMCTDEMIGNSAEGTVIGIRGRDEWFEGGHIVLVQFDSDEFGHSKLVYGIGDIDWVANKDAYVTDAVIENCWYIPAEELKVESSNTPDWSVK